MKNLTDELLIEAYVQALQLNSDKASLLLLENELMKRKLFWAALNHYDMKSLNQVNTKYNLDI